MQNFEQVHGYSWTGRMKKGRGGGVKKVILLEKGYVSRSVAHSRLYFQSQCCCMMQIKRHSKSCAYQFVFSPDWAQILSFDL